MMATPTVSSPPRPYYEPQARYGHSSNIIGEKLFTYGGEYGKAGTTSHAPSTIEIFDITRRMWEQKPTLGHPPPGFIHAASTTIGTKIYYYGGHNTSKYFNSMHTLDTVTLEWSEVGPRNPARNSEAPIAKAGGAMMSYLGKRLVVFGGFGEMPAKPTNKTLYVPTKRDKKRGWTSELHCFDIEHRTWTSPQITGSPPPACEGCSLTRVDEHRAVFFGGMLLGKLISNNVYILKLQSWTWITVLSGLEQPWPVGRQLHSAVSLHDADSQPSDPALLMMWGSGEDDVTHSDAWNFNVNTQQWQQVILLDSLSGRDRIDHTSSIVHRDSTHKQLVTHGGYHEWPKEGGIEPKTTTTIVELEHTPSGDWVVSDIIRVSQTGQTAETVIQPGDMSPSTLRVKMEQLNQELAKEVQEHKAALVRSKRTQLSLSQALDEKDLQIRSHLAKMTELQAALDRERRQREEGEKQLEEAEKQLEEARKQVKTNQELHVMQLKVDELEEKKDKLEGQLQFAQVEMNQPNRKLTKEVQEYKSALAHSQQTQQSLTLALAEKELQLSLHPAKMVELQAALEQQGAQLHGERRQREEGEKQLKTKEKELHDMQLKVEELEKKEKLEGQLQSTQDSIKEIQEQLTPPEKMDQAVQTHGEPSYLQISAQTSQKEREFQATLEQRESQLDWERQRREGVEQQLKDKQSKLDEMKLLINELQERQKLAGQLQSTQATREAAFPLKEMQERLSQPEKRDHKGLLPPTQATEATIMTKEIQEQLTPPEKKDQSVQMYTKPPFLQTSEATQSTREATTMTKEIQEQLPPPEKRDQTVQTHTEPPFLQTSEGPLPATQATGEATTMTKEVQEQLTPPEKRDQSVQTYTEPPFLQTSEVYQLRGVHVVGETTFTATRHSTTLNWEEYGFILHIPEGALPPDVEQCHIHVKATIRGQFQLPDDHKLVSAVFWIWCRHKLCKPATMEIEHCATITNEKQCSALTFVRTHCSQEKLPYTFTPVRNEVFTPGSRYGSISLSRFSGFGIASRILQWISGYGYPERYCAQLYSANKGVNVWKVYFVLTLDLKADMKAVEKYFSGVASVEIESFEVMLEEDEITLDIPEDGVHTKGWMIYPLYSPTIRKNRVNHFDRSGRSLPMCELVVKWLNDEGKPSWLAYRVRIKGVCASSNFFWLTINPTSKIGLSEIQQLPLSPNQPALQRVVPLEAANTVAICDVLKSSGFHPSSWQGLASRLGISDPDSVATQKPTDSLRLQETIRQWLEDDLKASWEKLADEVGRIEGYGHGTMQNILSNVGVAATQ